MSSPQPGSGGLTRYEQLPWLDYATTVMPTSHSLILWWAQYLWLTDGNFRTAFQRVGNHFITSISFPDLDPDEENAFKDLFTKHLNYRREMQSCADEYLCYGNLFVSLYLPFKRYMICAHCGFEQPIKACDWKLELSESRGLIWHRTKACSQCGDKTPFRAKDRKDPDISRVRINRYSPFEINIGFNRHSQKKELYWRMPSQYRQEIRTGARIHIEDTPMEFLEAVAYGMDVKLDEESSFHLDETIVTGMDTKGWGVPRSVSNFRSAWLMQTINRADQAICLDYTIGMRAISPAQQAGQSDPLQVENMRLFQHRVKNMIEQHRVNPATYHTVPYPLNYQFMGGEGQNLLPADKLKFRHQEFLNSMGIPLEYHSMTLSAQAAPMALQLFENCWQAVPAMYNQLLTWIVKVCSRNFDLEETSILMKPTTIAFDEARKQILTQLMSANQVSPETALAPLGIDANDEIKKVFSHQKQVAKAQQKADEDAQEEQEMGAAGQLNAAPGASALLQQQQQGAQGGGAGGGAGGAANGAAPDPSSPGGAAGQPKSIQAMSDQADQLAGQLVSMPEFDRKQQLKAIRESNKDLHALVIAKMEKVRSQAASQGQQQMLAPPAAGGAPPAQ
jgi:hypothetical protein